jgi:glycosyltransferase involved in cell wall biosynthesis
MKLLVLAHTPPPFHGQSYMVRILLDCFPSPSASTVAVQCVHVDFRLSSSVDDIGQRPWTKLRLVLRYAAEAVFKRFRYRADTLFYIPAPALPHAIYRDWLVMLLCRPFFRQTVFWWQAAGLGAWLEHQAKPWQRRLTRLLLGRPSLSVVMGTETEHDAHALGSRQVVVVPNTIPDPCPDDADQVVEAKVQHRESLVRAIENNATGSASEAPTGLFRLLFISLCYREKGLFDAMEAVALINRQLASRNSPVRVQLDVAGRFYLPSEQSEFEERIRKPDLQRAVAPHNANLEVSQHVMPAVVYHGFAGGDAKNRLFRECDCLIFPTYYAAESFGLVILEAMAHGMDIIATRWRNIPELLPADYPGLVEPRDPPGLAATIDLFLRQQHGAQLRRHFEDHHHLRHFQQRMEKALMGLAEVSGDASNRVPR